MHRWLIAVGLAAGCVGAAPTPPSGTKDAAVNPSIDAEKSPDAATTTFSFFITSTGGPSGGDLRQNVGDANGLAGADAICQAKAAAAVPAAATKQWRAYLSTGTLNARARIGTGPWFNVNGVMVATTLDNLHDAVANNVTKATALDETGAMVNGSGDTPNTHDNRIARERHGGGEPLQQLDKLCCDRRHRAGRPSRPHGWGCGANLMECRARDERLLGRRISRQRWSWLVLLLRDQLSGRRGFSLRTLFASV